MSGIGVILNPHSRSNRKNPRRADHFGFIVGDKGSCHTTDGIEDVRNLAREFKERDVEVLAISGGDGTYHHTLGIFIEVYNGTPLPKIAFLRGGTMNVVATDLNIQGTPEFLLSQLITRYHREEVLKTRPVSVLKINDQYGFIFGLGLVYRFVQEYYRTANNKPSKWHGLKLFSMVVVECLLNTRWIAHNCRSFDAQILVDEKEWPFKNYSCVLGGTVRSVGFGLNPFYAVYEDLSRFQMIGFSTPPRSTILNFGPYILGRPHPSEHFLDSLPKNVQIQCREPQGYMVDGEFYGPSESINISLGTTLQVVVD